MRLARRPLLVVGSVIVASYVLVGLLAPWLSPQTGTEASADHLLPPLSQDHLLGTDEFGRDSASRLIHGARTSLVVAVGVTGIAMLGGLVIGAAAGYFRGKTDAVLGGIIDTLWGFPNVLVAILLTAIFGPGLMPVMIAVGMTNGAALARIVRAESMSLRERDFVRAAVGLGYGSVYIIARHIVPNVMAPLFVMTSYYMGLAIIVEAAFGFLGLGAQPPTASWGQMLADGQQYLRLSHWLVTLPGLSIAIVVLGFNLLGDELRDVIDPRLKDRF